MMILSRMARQRAIDWLTASGVALAAVSLFTLQDSQPLQAKTPGSTYCFYGKCHRVKTITETQALVGSEHTLHTSFYDHCKSDRYNPCGLTSSGEQFHPDRADNAASPIYPDGTKLLVWSPRSGEAAVIRINNAGPYWGNRKLDVSKALAEKFGFEHQGVSKLDVRVLSAPTADEARYKRNRKYDRVNGPIGKFDSLADAHTGLAVLLAFEAMSSSVLAPAVGSALAEVDRPFEVAAAAADGRAFAILRPELAAWPVIGAPVALTQLAAWPVVNGPPKRTGGVLTRLASTPVGRSVRPEPPQSRPAGLRLAGAEIDWPIVQALQSRPGLVDTGWVAAPEPSEEPSDKAESRKNSSRSAARVKRTKSATHRKAERHKASRRSAARTKRRARAKSSVPKPAAPAKPRIATRDILHRHFQRES